MAAITPPSPAETSKPKKNIFSSPLQEVAKGKTAKKLELKKKNNRKSFIYFVLSAIFLGTYSYMFLFPNVEQYMNFDKAIADVEEQIGNYEIILSDSKEVRDTHKAAYDEEFKGEIKVIDTVFPETTEKLEVVRLLENFATHLATAYPPFEFSSVSFQKEEKVNGYTVLPFQTSIHSSKTNFERFLKLVNLSGNADPENPDHIRLMEISTISLRYRGPDTTGKDQGVDFTVKLKAYSR